MTKNTCGKLISEMVFKKDRRNPPNNDKNSRKGKFKAGWKKDTMAESTLKKHLTWCNLGYRLKKKLGNKNDDEINEIFESFANHYSENL
jgi:hypothetical protein